MSVPRSKYFNRYFKELVNSKEAQVIEVGKVLKIDKDNILIKRIINTQDGTYIRYAFMTLEQGWSFTESDIKVFDDKGKQYQYRGGESSGKSWGSDGLFEVERIDKGAKYIILKLECYDRKNEMRISLEEEGEIDENK